MIPCVVGNSPHAACKHCMGRTRILTNGYDAPENEIPLMAGSAGGEMKKPLRGGYGLILSNSTVLIWWNSTGLIPSNSRGIYCSLSFFALPAWKPPYAPPANAKRILNVSTTISFAPLRVITTANAATINRAIITKI